MEVIGLHISATAQKKFNQNLPSALLSMSNYTSVYSCLSMFKACLFVSVHTKRLSTSVCLQVNSIYSCMSIKSVYSCLSIRSLSIPFLLRVKSVYSWLSCTQSKISFWFSSRNNSLVNHAPSRSRARGFPRAGNFWRAVKKKWKTGMKWNNETKQKETFRYFV